MSEYGVVARNLLLFQDKLDKEGRGDYEMNKERILELADHIEECEHYSTKTHTQNDLWLLSKNSNYPPKIETLFYMNSWILDDGCESPGCIAGHACYLYVSDSEDARHSTSYANKAKHLLGLSGVQAAKLFIPKYKEICTNNSGIIVKEKTFCYILEVSGKRFSADKETGHLIDLNDQEYTGLVYNLITPKVAAATLRNFVKTGEVVWQLGEE